MAEYINRNSIYNKLQALFNYWLNSIESQTISISYAKQRILPMIMEELPASDVAPVRHGEWLHTEEPLGWKDVDCMECSACHDSWIIEEDYCFDDMPRWNYCPSCGAKMYGGED